MKWIQVYSLQILISFLLYCCTYQNWIQLLCLVLKYLRHFSQFLSLFFDNFHNVGYSTIYLFFNLRFFILLYRILDLSSFVQIASSSLDLVFFLLILHFIFIFIPDYFMPLVVLAILGFVLLDHHSYFSIDA